MASLTSLDLTNNNLTEIPSSLKDLSHLGELPTHILDNINIPSGAEILYLRSNKLTSVPVLTSCVNLKELHLGNNRIQGKTWTQLEEEDLIALLVARFDRAGRGEHRQCATVGPAGEQDHAATRGDHLSPASGETGCFQ